MAAVTAALMADAKYRVEAAGWISQGVARYVRRPTATPEQTSAMTAFWKHVYAFQHSHRSNRYHVTAIFTHEP